jgi:hypothetical protein
MTRNLFPDDWDGERALAVADFLYGLADEILGVYDGAIRIYYRDCAEHGATHNPDQLELPLDLDGHCDHSIF